MTLESARTVVRAELSCGAFDAFSAVRFADRFPPHFHDTFAIGVIESGTSRLRTPRGEWIAGPGTILAFSPHEIHCAEPVADAGYTYRMIYPGRELLDEIGVRGACAAERQPLFSAPVIYDPALAAEFVEAHIPLMAADSPVTTQSRLITVLRSITDRYGRRESRDHEPGARDRAAVQRALEILHTGFTRQVRLRTLADECGLSPFHLLRLFRDAVGVPPHAYLVQLRVNRAQVLLQEGHSVSEVAHVCGFSDQPHFTRTFKRTVGVPPGQYIRRARTRVA